METQNVITMDQVESAEASGDLDSYIGSVEPVAVDENGEPVSFDVSDTYGGEGDGGYDLSQNAAPVDEPTPRPQVDSALAAQLAAERHQRMQLQETIRAAALRNLQAEDRALAAELQNMDPSDPVRQARELAHQLKRQNMLLQIQERKGQQATQVLQTMQQQAEAQRQGVAKSQVALILAQNHGIPMDQARVLMTAPTPEAMEQMAQAMGTVFIQAARANTGMHPNARQSGGLNAPSAPANKPAERSGDLGGLIQSRGYYQVVQ